MPAVGPFPVVPTTIARNALQGGSYRLHEGGTTPSFLLLPLLEPDALA